MILYAEERESCDTRDCMCGLSEGVQQVRGVRECSRWGGGGGSEGVQQVGGVRGCSRW